MPIDCPFEFLFYVISIIHRFIDILFVYFFANSNGGFEFACLAIQNVTPPCMQPFNYLLIIAKFATFELFAYYSGTCRPDHGHIETHSFLLSVE